MISNRLIFYLDCRDLSIKLFTRKDFRNMRGQVTGLSSMNLNQFDFVTLVPGTKFGSCDLIFPQNWAFHIEGLGPHNALVTGTSPLVCANV